MLCGNCCRCFFSSRIVLGRSAKFLWRTDVDTMAVISIALRDCYPLQFGAAFVIDTIETDVV